MQGAGGVGLSAPYPAEATGGTIGCLGVWHTTPMPLQEGGKRGVEHHGLQLSLALVPANTGALARNVHVEGGNLEESSSSEHSTHTQLHHKQQDTMRRALRDDLPHP